ncbi:MAG TPA: hypothetical protein VGB90_02645 [Alphaproteobacteria bacterium]
MKSENLKAVAPLFVGIAVLAWSVQANAAIKSPNCAELTQFAKAIAPGQFVPVNNIPSRFQIPKTFAEPIAAQVYGVPTLDWTNEDVALAIKLAGDCGAAARKARNTPDIQALGVLWQSLGAVRSTIGGLTVTEQRLDQRLAQYLPMEPSRAMLVSLNAVMMVREGTATSFQQADKAMRDHAMQVGLTSQAQNQAGYVLGQMRDLPVRSWNRVFAAVEKRIPEVRQWVITDAHAQINATEESPRGLQLLGPALTKAKNELRTMLPESEVANLDKTATDRRNAIENALLAKELARVNEVPENAAGLNQLNMIRQTPTKSVLSAQRVASLDAKIGERRTAIGNTVTDEQIKQLDRFPEDMSGLRDLDQFKNNTERGLAQLAGPAAATRFGEAAKKRATKIGEASFRPFRKAIEDVPENEEGLSELDKALNEIKGPIASLDAPIRARYTEAASERREEIVAAVKKEDARLARLSLPGGIFVDPRAGAKLEFRNRSRLYLTIFNQTSEAEYEVDGDRVIIRMPTGNQVFTKEGPWIKGQGLAFKRQSDRK